MSWLFVRDRRVIRYTWGFSWVYLCLPYLVDGIKSIFSCQRNSNISIWLVSHLSLSSEVADRQDIKIPEERSSPWPRNCDVRATKYGIISIEERKFPEAFFDAPTRVEKTPLFREEPIVKFEKVPGRLGNRGESDSKGGVCGKHLKQIKWKLNKMKIKWNKSSNKQMAMANDFPSSAIVDPSYRAQTSNYAT